MNILFAKTPNVPVYMDDVIFSYSVEEQVKNLLSRYYWKMIANYVKISKPLTNALRNNNQLDIKKIYV